MIGSLGDLVVNFTANASPFLRGVQTVRRQMGGFAGYARQFGDTLKANMTSALVAIPAMIGAAVTGATALIGHTMAQAAEAAREALQEQLKLESVIRATGGAAGFSAGALAEYAASLQRVTNYGDDATIGAMALLATFREVKGQTFLDAVPLIQDMASVLGTDLKNAALQVGKALNDPVAGITALRRSGVSFSESQREMIQQMMQTNNLAGAQRMVLAELANEFGGAAQAMRDPVSQFKEAWGDVYEEIGGPLLPYVNLASAKLIEFAGYLKENAGGIAVVFEHIANGVQFVWRYAQLASAAWRGFAGLLTDTLATITGSKELRAFSDEVYRLAAGDLDQFNAPTKSIADQVAEFQRELDAARASAKSLVSVVGDLPDTMEATIGAAQHLVATLNLPDPLEVNRDAAAAWGEDMARQAQQRQDSMRSAGAELTESLRTPLETFRDEMERIRQLRQGNFIDDRTYGRALKDLIGKYKSEASPGLQFAGLAVQGSAAAHRSILEARGQAHDSTQRAADTTVKSLPELVSEAKRIAARLEKQETARDI